jgi:hypothetical protein
VSHPLPPLVHVGIENFARASTCHYHFVYTTVVSLAVSQSPTPFIETMPRVQKPSKPRHDPLHVEIEADSSVRQFGRVTKPGKRRAGRDDEDEVEGVSVSPS